MHFLGISAPIFCLVWHFIVSVSNVILVFTIFDMESDDIITRAFIAFSIISVIVYASIASPLFVYSYKYGTSMGNRSGRFLSGVSVMFLFSSLPMALSMLAILITSAQVNYFFVFVFEVALQTISFFCGLFVSWFAYMRVVAAAFHKWRGPERQILPYQEDGSGEIYSLGGRGHIGFSAFPQDEHGNLI